MNMKTNKNQNCNMTVENNNNKTNGADIMNNKTYKTQIENNTVELSTKTGNGTKFVLVINNRKVYTSEDLTVNNTDLCWLINKYYDGELSTTEVLNNIIIDFNNVEAEAPAPVEGTTDVLGVTYKASEIPEGFDAEAEHEDDDVTVESRVNPLTRKLIECSYDFNNRVFNIKGAIVKVPTHKLSVNPSNLKATVKATIKKVTKVRKESLYDLSNRVLNIAGKLVKAPLMPIARKVRKLATKLVHYADKVDAVSFVDTVEDDYDYHYYRKFEVRSRFSNWNGTPQF